MHRSPMWLALGLLSATAILGCSQDEDPLPPAEVHAQVETHVHALLDEANAAVAGSWDVLPRPDVLGLLEQVVGVDTPVARLVHQLAAQLATRPAALDSAAVIAYLNDRLFADASYLGDGLYEVGPSVVCGASDDPACASRVTRLGLRLRTAPVPRSFEADSGVAVAVQLGASHDEPLALTLRILQVSANEAYLSVTAELDLDVLQRALVAIGELDLPPTVLAGHVTLVLHGDPSGASLRLALDRPVTIAIAGPSGNLAGRDAFSLSAAMAATATKVFDLVLVSGHPLGTASLGLGETRLELPAGADGKRVGLHLAGLIADAALQPPPLQLGIADLSLGGRPATLTLDGETARTLALNPDDGGAMFLALRRDAGITTLHATPRLDLRMTADHRVLGDAPGYDVSRVLLDGEVRATGSPDRLELRTGSFRIDTAPAGHGFAAVAGDCITSTRPPAVQWTVGACD